ncbi:MAG: DUF1080 domain-containing protein [Saonia sp.]
MRLFHFLKNKKKCFILLFLFTFYGFSQTFPIEGEQESGFYPIFDGKTLEGWQGDPEYWSVKDGAIVGEVRADNLLSENSFLIYNDSIHGDFELKVHFKVSEKGNSGINYRSSKVPNRRYALKGYQADIDGQQMWTGQNYEERGRTFLALRGQVTSIKNDKTPELIGSVGTKALLASHIRPLSWNEYHLIIRSNILIHMINKKVMSITIDDDDQNRKFGGWLGVQVHVGPPMKIAYKNFRVKKLE